MGIKKKEIHDCIQLLQSADHLATRLARFQPNIWLQLVIHIVVGLGHLFWMYSIGFYREHLQDTRFLKGNIYRTHQDTRFLHGFCHQLGDVK